ncbi:MAG: hypothetical protein HN613_05295 [Gammaproteobacteria bacterium]|jgi:glutathione S-transferase|nr:hypothetical protein [Gammaproteobacteria bacterium]MBT7603865.1 hypothetical protein [Gammaproteobacteria bacterium]
MKELFDDIAISVDAYGADGDMKKTQYVLDLIGSVSNPETYKCILAASEQGMEMNCYALENLNDSQFDEMKGETLALRESDFIISGSEAIVAFIDARGLGYSLELKNAQLAAIQNYWVDIANVAFSDSVCKLIYGNVGKRKDKHTLTKDSLEKINLYLDALDKQLKNNKYIVCNKYTFADLHWTAYIHFILISDYEDLIDNKKNIQDWLQRIKSRKSQCGQEIVAYDNLPNKTDIENKKLSSVRIGDF